MKPNWFIGFPLPDTWVAGALHGIPPELRTFRGEDIHITVAFLGAVGADAAHRAWAVVEALDPAALGGPFALTLGRIEPFGDPRKPSSLSVVPAPGEDHARQLIERHRPALREAAGIAPDDRPVRPHATIARIKRRAPESLRAAAIAWAAAAPPVGACVRVQELGLYTWTDDRRHQLFRVVARRALG